MSFNDQLQAAETGGQQYSIFKAGVRSKNMAGDKPVYFQIMPAYDYTRRTPGGANDPSGWLPFRLPNGNVTEWGVMLQVARFVGHDQARRDILSPRTFDNAAPCPVTTLFQYAARDKDWQYLIEDLKSPDGKSVLRRAALKKPSKYLVVNVLELDGDRPVDVSIGMLSPGATKSLTNAGTGLINQASGTATPEQVEKDYLMGYAYHDITSPLGCPVFSLCKQDVAKGQYAAYVVVPVRDARNFIVRRPIGADMLARRYDMSEIKQHLNVMTPEEVVDVLVQLLNQRGANGRHEHELLKLVFGDMYRIPEPPHDRPMVGMGGNETRMASAVHVPFTPVAPAASPVPPMATAPLAGPFTAPVTTETTQAAPQQPVTVPGDAVKPFSAKDFLKRIEEQNNAARGQRQ